jgi:hypothetical protein
VGQAAKRIFFTFEALRRARSVGSTSLVVLFCHAELPSSFREVTPTAPPSTRLSRAALYALGVGTLSVTTVACGGEVADGGREKDSGQSDAKSIPDAGSFIADAPLS